MRIFKTKNGIDFYLTIVKGKRNIRNSFLVKHFNNFDSFGIISPSIFAPKEFIGKKVRIKLEVIENVTKNIIGIFSPPYAGQLTDEGGNQEINQVKNRPHPYTKNKEDRVQIGNFTRNEWG